MKKLVVVILLLAFMISASALTDTKPVPIPIKSPQNPIIGFSTVEVIDEYTGNIIEIYSIEGDL